MSFYRKANGHRHFRPSIHPGDASRIARARQERQEKIRAGIRADIARARSAAVPAASSGSVSLPVCGKPLSKMGKFNTQQKVKYAS